MPTFRNRYFLVFFLTALVLITNQLVIQYYLYNKRTDAQTINIAGKQRMYSQKLMLEVALAKGDKSPILALFTEWEKSHLALKNQLLALKSRNHEVQSALSLLQDLDNEITFFNRSVFKEISVTDIEPLRTNQNAFLQKMDKVVGYLQSFSNQKLKRIVWIEIGVLIFSLTLLYYEFRQIFIPVTERLRLQNLSLQEHISQLRKYKEVNAYLSNFSHVLSHDIQSPAKTIFAFSKLLLNSIEPEVLDKKQIENLKFIHRSSGELLSLVNDLLQFVQLDQTQIQLNEIKLSELLSDIKLTLKSELEKKDGLLHFEKIPKTLIADKTKLKMIFYNLIKNGIKYSKHGTPPRISVSSEEKENHYLFKISDNGIGIHQSQIKKIFGLFVKLNPNTPNSSGVGLALVKKAVELHRGTIEVNSEINKGTEFIFTIKKFTV